MAGEACGSLPSALPQPYAQDGGTQVAPHAVKKRKRATKSDEQVPHCNTGQSPPSHMLPHVTLSVIVLLQPCPHSCCQYGSIAVTMHLSAGLHSVNNMGFWPYETRSNRTD